MAGKKFVITSKHSTKTITGTKFADEFLFKSGAVQVTAKASKGNDKITVNDGWYHKIYGDAGKDKITLNKGNSLTVYGGDGDDVITIGKKAGNQMTNTVYGGKGNDTINVYGGGNVSNSGVCINGQWVYGGPGKDIITVFKGNSHVIYGDGGNDTIMIKAGNEHLIQGGSGNDDITIIKGNKQNISGDGGNDNIIIKAGSKEFISGDAGNDTITVNKGKGHEIYGGSGNDTINLKGCNASYIQGDAGDDTVTISGGATVSGNRPTSFHDPGLVTGEGNDTVTIAADAGKVAKLYSGAGDDTIIVRGGSGHEIHTGEGTDKVTVTGGKNLKIYLDDGKNTVTLSGASTTIYTGYKSADDITVKWTKGKQNGTCQIVTPYLASDVSDHCIDTLTIKGAKSSDFNFSYANDTLTLSNSDGSLSVNQLFTPFDFRNEFKGGITFDDGTLSIADLGKKVGVTV